jgi:hypothetical protein
MSEPGQGAATGGNSPGNGGNPAPWFGDSHAQLVQTKGWKSADDVLTSYSQLEKHMGAPADRLIRLPEKPDAPEWGEIRKKVGWAAPEKPEDYGIQVPEGGNADYVSAMTKAFHEAGVPKDTAAKIAQANNEFIANLMKAQGEQQTAARTEAIKAADKLIADRFGEKAPKMQEAMLREAVRLGIKAEEMEALEADLADAGHLDKFRTLLADIAEARAEGSFHQQQGGGSFVMSPEQAKAALEAKRKDPEWVTKALTRGTPEAAENIRLNALAAGVQMSPEEIERQAKGLGPKQNTY